MASLAERVREAAQSLLDGQHYVCAVDLFATLRWIHPSNVESWRKGRLDCLFSMLQVRAESMDLALQTLHEWAAGKGLRSTEGRYVRAGRAGTEELKFTPDANPEVERRLRIHYVAADLPAAKARKIEEKQQADPRPVVFEIPRGAECTECGVEIEKGDLLWMEKDQPLCLACAGWGGMEYLGRGDVALTRRATKYSSRSAVIVSFSRSRGRYERQGILVEGAAIEKAEQECAADAEDRAKARARSAAARRKDDAALVEQMTARMLQLFPACPAEEAEAIARHTAERGSGRVGRSAAGRSLKDNALELAVRASVRHRHTRYDSLLAGGLERDVARELVIDDVELLVHEWRGKR